ncbi:hypothetical protein [Paludisphaera rhizosphaerae]|uniref:hypothetical protein n=1 Tax=Paludisphaera rhizosphaerae TaxID=2711216 RepID=UPI0013EDE9DF|nr:hypothetical protein [Paludisphaera rhizosphaerae]
MNATRLTVGVGLLGLSWLFLRADVHGQTIWVEAEKPERATVSRHPWWYDQVKKDQLSGGDWISNWSDDKDGELEYSIQVPAAGRYAFWVRANPVQAKLSYRVDKGAWTPIDLATDVLDSVNVAGDGKPDLRFIGWKKAGELDLKKGVVSIAFKMSSENHHHGAMDAFVLTTEPFSPNGTARPGKVAAPTVEPGMWPFLPERDTFRADAVLDLRGLNEKVAGESGFVKLAPDGESFVLGDGKPVRFWAVTTYVQRDRSAEDLAHHARFLAKRGVNMVRLHGALEPKAKDAKLTDADPKTIEEAWKLVAAMKKEGIYTTLSPYWASALKHIPTSWGIEGWPENQGAEGLLFFNPRFQEGYRAWLKALLTPPNPYTGIPLAKDPALAIIQLQNEDSMLFWTMQSVKGRQLQVLGEQFGQWLAKKYGSIAAASKAWGGDSMKEDDFARGVVGIHIVWEWTQPRQGGKKKRLDDQLQFFAETMHKFNEETAKYLREELGCNQLVNAGNWKTADTTLLNDVERWSYTANEVIAVNNYYSPVHIGPDRGWRIDKGDRFVDVSALVDPRALPLNIKQVAGHPMMVTESHWVPPLGYQSEGPFLVAAMQSLTGVDAFYWFGTSETEWSNTDRAEWDAASRQKWAIATPMVLGQFPASALIYRRGYLKQGEPVVVEHRSPAQLWGRAVPLISEDPSYDPNRDKGDAARRSSVAGSVDPLAFLAGPVKVVYDSDPSKTKAADLGKLIDHDRRVVRSTSGEIAWAYGKGVCKIDAPQAQGASGFLKSVSPIKFQDVTIESSDEYATIVLASLDGLPIKESRRVLVQVGTLARPTGWADRAATFLADDGKRLIQGKEIVSTGKMPWAIKDADATLRIANPALAAATQLDVNGNRGPALPTEASGGTFTLKLPKDAFYIVVEAR